MLDVVIRLGLLLAIFASVFIVALLALGTVWQSRSRATAINRRLRIIREGGDREELIMRLRKNAPGDFSGLPPFLAHRLRGFQRTLHASAVPFTMSQVLTAMGGLLVLLFVVFLFVALGAGFSLTAGALLLLLAFAACIACFLPAMIISYRAQRQRKRIEQQFPVALDIFVRALRSGHPIASAIELLTQEMEDPIGSEFGLIFDEVSYGADLIDALQAMAERWDQEDMHMFVVSLSVQNETGGNLAEILENLAHVIRARAGMYMKVRALSSEGRMTGWMLTVLPILTFVGMFIVNPSFYLDVADDPIFMIGFPALIVIFVIGVITIRKMVDLKV